MLDNKCYIEYKPKIKSNKDVRKATGKKDKKTSAQKKEEIEKASNN